jgi:hypothetical protein
VTLNRWPYVEPDDDEPDDDIEAPELVVEITEPTAVGRLFGPDGRVLATLYDRRIVPFGFVSGG